MAVTVTVVGSNLQIVNDFVGVRVPMGSFGDDHAPIQGIRHADGTWVATGPNFLQRRSWYETVPLSSDPILSAVTTIVTNTSSLVVVLVTYSLDRPFADFGSGITFPAGTGFYTCQITVKDAEPVILMEEHSDCDIGYSLNVDTNLNANQAQYRGHSALTLEAGYESGFPGTIYGTYNLSISNDATVTFFENKKVSYNHQTGQRGPLITWTPYSFDTGFYWYMYNSAAGSTANLFGIFSGPASRIIGAPAAGTGIWNATGVGAGVTMEINRIAPDLQYSSINRFAWGITVATKGDYLIDSDFKINPILIQFNRHSGLGLKTDGYLATFDDPVGGYGGLYMGTTAVNALKARVLGDSVERDRLLAADASASALIQLWYANDAAALAGVVAEVVTDTDEIITQLTTGKGIYGAGDGDVTYFEMGFKCIRLLLYADQALGHSLISAADALTVKKRMNLCASMLWDDDFVPWTRDESGNFIAAASRGLSNNQSQYESYRNGFAVFLGNDSDWGARALYAQDRTVTDFRSIINEYGSSNAASDYIAPNVQPTTNLMLQIRQMLGRDIFAEESRAGLFGNFLLHYLTPLDPRFGNIRKRLTVGDYYGASEAMHGIMATGLRPSQPTLAAYLQKAWEEEAEPHHSFFGSTMLMIDESATATDYTLGDAIFPGYLYVIRGYETSKETVRWVIDGHHYVDHRPINPGTLTDQGTISFYAFDVPISVTWSTNNPHIYGAVWHSTVQPSAEIGAYWDQAGLPYTQGQVGWTSGAVRGDFTSSSLTWRRIAKLPGVEGRYILAVRDVVNDECIWTINLMATGTVQPRNFSTGAALGGNFTPPLVLTETPLTQENAAAGNYRWRFTGWWGIDFDLFLIVSNLADFQWTQYVNTDNPTREKSEFLAATGTVFHESQYTLRIRTTGEVRWVIVPYTTGNVWGGSISPITGGVQITGPLGAVQSVDLTTYLDVVPPIPITFGEVRARFAGRPTP